MPHARRIVLVTLASAAVVASTRVVAARPMVRGSGTIVTERRAASGIERIAVSGDVDVEIRQGTQEGIELSGDDDILPLIETRIEGSAGARTLKIGPRDDLSWTSSRPVRVRVDLVKLAALDLGGPGRVVSTGLHVDRLAVAIGGSGRVELPRLVAERLQVSIGGSGHIDADGRAKTLAVGIGGSGNCAFAKLAADDVSVSIAGSGSADLDAARSLHGSVVGSGRLRYTGGATASVSVAGSGKIERR